MSEARKPHSEHLAAFRAWALAEKASPCAEWRIDRAQARSLFEQYEGERAKNEKLSALIIEQEGQYRDEKRGLLEQLETLREAAEQVVRGCEAWPSWTTGHIGFTLRTALTSNPASEPKT